VEHLSFKIRVSLSDCLLTLLVKSLRVNKILPIVLYVHICTCIKCYWLKFTIRVNFQHVYNAFETSFACCLCIDDFIHTEMLLIEFGCYKLDWFTTGRLTVDMINTVLEELRKKGICFYGQNFTKKDVYLCVVCMRCMLFCMCLCCYVLVYACMLVLCMFMSV